MKVIKRYPDIRFKGFSQDWEQRKLKDYLTIPKKEVVDVVDSSQLMTLRLNLGGAFKGSIRETLSLGATKYYRREKGQLIYGKQNFFNGSMAIIPNDLDGLATSSDVPSFNINNIDTKYLFSYISRHDYWSQKEAYSSGTGSKRIHEKTLLSFDINVPKLKEQMQIGSFFETLDNTIALHQRKIESIEKLKKYLLSKIFPKNGSSNPEVRFDGFSNDWEQRKLSTMLKYEQPTKYIVENDSYDDSFTIPVLTAGKSFLLGYTNEKNGIKYATSDQPLIIFDDFTTSSHFVDFPFKVKSSALKILEFTDISNNSYFTFLTLKNIKYTPQNHQRHWIQMFSDLKVLATTKEEETKIGVFFENIDDTITLHQRKYFAVFGV